MAPIVPAHLLGRSFRLHRRSFTSISSLPCAARTAASMHSSPAAAGAGRGASPTPPSKAGRQRSRSEHRNDEPSSSGSGSLTRALFEQLQADHIAEQKEQQQAFFSKMQEWTTDYVSNGEQKVLGKMGKLLENFETALEPRFWLPGGGGRSA